MYIYILPIKDTLIFYITFLIVYQFLLEIAKIFLKLSKGIFPTKSFS